MGRMPSSERRQLLSDAALRVMGAQGLAHATTRAIVAEAGMSLASFHYAFRSRDELLIHVMQQVVDAEASAAFLTLRPGRDIEGSIAAGFHALLAYVVADPEHERALQELLHHAMVTPGLGHLARAQYASYHRAVGELLTEAATAANVRWIHPIADVARFVVTLTDGLTLAWLADRDTPAAERMVDFAVAAVVELTEPISVPLPRSA